MATVVDALNKAGLQGQIKVLIGGAPITQAFADRSARMVLRPMRPWPPPRASEMVGV